MTQEYNKFYKFEIYMKKLPDTVAYEYVTWFKQSFRKQGFVDEYLKKWKKRQRGRKKDNTRHILVKTGKLRNAVRIKSVRKTSTGEAYICIANEMPYSQIHNEGFKGTIGVKAHRRKKRKTEAIASDIRTHKQKKARSSVGHVRVKAHKRKVNMPKRQFIGNSKALERKIKKAIEKKFSDFLL